MDNVILMKQDKTLTLSSRGIIYINENNADNFVVLVPKNYGSYYISNCIATLHYINENNQGDIITLNFEDELYKDSFYKEIIPISNRFTSFPGNITLWIEIIDSNSNFILKTNTVSTQIRTHISVEDILEEQQLTLLQDWQIKMDQSINSCNIVLKEIIEVREEIIAIAKETIKVLEQLGGEND